MVYPHDGDPVVQRVLETLVTNMAAIKQPSYHHNVNQAYLYEGRQITTGTQACVIIVVPGQDDTSGFLSCARNEHLMSVNVVGAFRFVALSGDWKKQGRWLLADMVRAVALDIQLGGDDYTFAAVTPPVRVGNYTQILRKDWILSNTQEVVDTAGQMQKRKMQKLKSGVEIRKDVEFAIVDSNASVSGATREFGSLSTWLTSNVSRGSNGVNGGFSQSTGLTVATTDGTLRAFTKALLDTVMQDTYVSGGNVRHCVVSPYVKTVFVTFMSDSNVASFRYAAQDGKGNSIVANADMYEGPHGKIMIHPNRVMATSATTARNAFLLDTEMLAFPWLRRIQEDKGVAKTGDARKGVIIGEGALKVKNEAGLGVVADVFGLTAST